MTSRKKPGVEFWATVIFVGCLAPGVAFEAPMLPVFLVKGVLVALSIRALTS